MFLSAREGSQCNNWDPFSLNIPFDETPITDHIAQRVLQAPQRPRVPPTCGRCYERNRLRSAQSGDNVFFSFIGGHDVTEEILGRRSWLMLSGH